MKKNSNLNKAKKAKCDEFYTQLSDIEKELQHYLPQLKGKVVFCNCDSEKSNFWKYFKDNFHTIGLKKVIAIGYEKVEPAYKLEYDGKEVTRTKLEGDGDFRSPESIEVLEQADIVVSNPPFSIWREYIAQLVEYDKKFLVIGSMNAITYKECFKLIKEDKMWLGYNNVKDFVKPDGTIQKFGNINWFTNMETTKRKEKLILFREYDPELHQKYDNYDAINCDKVKDIPKDYYKTIGVPITFLDKYNPDQFEIIGCVEPCINIETLKLAGKFTEYKSRQLMYNGNICQKTYHRILIRRKDTGESFI